MEIPNAIRNRVQDNKTIYPVTISEYLKWAANPIDCDEPLLLPPIQRGFIWKPKQIQDLWDSLLRGMPISSLLVQRFDKYDSARFINEGEQKQEVQESGGWYLLDGQQRTLSMLLGFPHEIDMKHKLWIDFSEEGYKYGTKFQFRVSTEYQPFGYRPDGYRLSLNDRRKARIKWGVSSNTSRIKIFEHNKTRPWKAGENKQEHLLLVSDLWRHMDDADDCITTWKQDVEKMIGIGFQTQDERERENERTRIEEFGKNLISLKTQSLALIEVKKTNIKDTKAIKYKDQDYLTLLFERVSRGGTQLSAEDLLFSMMKQKWPESHNLVNEFHKRVGVMLSPTDFVMTAFRLAALRQDKNNKKLTDQARPKSSYFHAHLSELLGTEEKEGVLRKIINDHSLVEKFETLKKCISYRGYNDIGLPNAYLPMLERSLLQVIMNWCLDVDESMIEESREELIRFILFWEIARKDTSSALKASTEIMKKGSSKIFPIKEYYNVLTKKINENGDSIFFPLVHAQKDIKNEKVFHDYKKRAILSFGNDGVGLYYNFISRRKLLLWFQRKWVHQEYGGENIVNFLSGQDEDAVPYDFDHLLPQSNWYSFQGKKNNLDLKDENNYLFRQPWARHQIGNSIGNYRVMDASSNRGRKDESLSTEIIDKSSSQEYWDNYAFGSIDDEKQYWLDASCSDQKKNWDDARVIAFQNAVERRTLYLYKRLFKDAGFASIIN